MAIDQTTTETPKNPPPGASAPTVQTIEDLLAAPPDVKLAMIERTTDVLLALATSLMSEEVRSMAGPRYSRHKPYGGRYVRWGSNPGSVRVGAERVPVAVPRVRDRETGTERPLRSYRALHEGTDPGPKMAEAVLLGLAQRDYERVARTSAESFGLSQSTVSRRFTEEAQAALEDLEARDLSGEPYLVLWLDGKQLRGRQVVICIGATTAGQKRVLGFTEASTENAPAVKGLLRRLIDRGLDFSGGLLVVTDGSKGLRSAVQATFGGYAVLQRCHWHKRENVLAHLPKDEQPAWRHRLRAAMNETTRVRAETALRECVTDLKTVSRPAARSLEEGFDDVLAVHRLGVGPALGHHLRTTNMIESVNAHVQTRLRKIKHYLSSDQRCAWVAMALWEAEERFYRLSGYRHLPLLQQALRRHIDTLTEDASAPS